MGETELVSVIVPVYNHSGFVREAILSVVQQTYYPIELIVIDDGSTDGSVEVIAELQKEFDFYFITRGNKGVSATLNEGIKKSKGNFICLLASDDLFKKDKLKTQVEFLQSNPEFAMCCSLAETIDKNGTVLQKTRENIKEEALTFDGLLNGNTIAALTVMIRRNVFENVGYFDESLRMEDWDMWLRIAKEYKIGFIPEVLASYRVHETNSSSDSLMLMEDGLKILEKWRMYPQVKETIDDIYKKYTLHFAKLGKLDYLRIIFKHKSIFSKKYFISSLFLFVVNSPRGLLRGIRNLINIL